VKEKRKDEKLERGSGKEMFTATTDQPQPGIETKYFYQQGGGKWDGKK